jgi:t-SNARE complex subunit (syntaxin)
MDTGLAQNRTFWLPVRGKSKIMGGMALNCELQSTIAADLSPFSATSHLCMQGLEEGSNEERTRTGITNSLKTKLADLMRDFSSLRNNITSHYRDVVDRRYEIVTGEKASEDQLDQLIETGEAENLFQKAILSQGRGKVCS